MADVGDARSPRTNATASQLFERYLDVLTIEDTTRTGYKSSTRNIRPLLGHLAGDRMDGEVNAECRYE